MKVWFQNRRTKHKRIVPDEQSSSAYATSPLATIPTEEEEEMEENEEEEEEKDNADKKLSTTCCIPSGSLESTDDEFVDVDTLVAI